VSAEDVLAVLDDLVGGVEVVGTGPLAHELRARLGTRARVEGRPDAVVDTTGTTAALVAALARVADLGTVVLAAPQDPDEVPLDLYPDLHLRGLVLLGLPGTGSD
jgi:threonine dehydrogenase-like Zn-dependent dehydrogenase